MNTEIILKSKYVVISVMGPHAGESSEEIFSRKIDDVKNIGKTCWVINSYKANPEIIKKMKKDADQEQKEIFCIFIEPSFPGGARPTTESKQAKEFSVDKQSWELFSNKLSPVTGKITKNAYSMVFNELSILDEETSLNLWDYADFNEQESPILPNVGKSTFCAIKKDTSNHSKKIKTNLRKIMAIGKLHNEGYVWLR